MALTAQRFEHDGGVWTRRPAEQFDGYVCGVDLGASLDYTAIGVLRHHCEPLPGDWIVDRVRKTTTQPRDERYEVLHLERVKLGTTYPEIVDHVAALLSRSPLRQAGVDLIVDETGVGRPVADLFDAQGLRPIKCVITAGYKAEKQSERRWSAPKHILVSGLDAKLHTGELRIAGSLTEAGALADELKDFRRIVSGAGRATYSARVGKHDDLILAVALAAWWATERRRRAQQGFHAAIGGMV